VGASIWFGVTFGAYFLFHTVYFVPYGALGFELTLDYNERSSLFGWTQAFSLVGSCIAGATPFVVSAAFKGSPRTGYVLVGIFFSVLLVGLFAWTIIRIRERPEFASRESNPIVPGVRLTLRNRPFRVLLMVYVVSSLTGAIPVTVAPFYIPYVLKAENDGLVLTLTIVGYVISGAISIPLWVYLARKLGKRGAWFLSIWIGITGGSSFFFMGEGDTTIFLIMILYTGLALGAGLLHPAMKADIIDYDELHTGKRREAQFASFWAIVPKFVAIPSAALPLAVLGAVGYVPNQEQPELVSFTLRALLGLSPAITGIAAFLIALRFPMTEARHRAVLEGIAQHKRGETAEDPLTGRPVSPPSSRENDDATRWYLDHFSRRELRRVQRLGSGSIALRVGSLAALCLALTLGLVSWVYAQLGDVSEQPGPGVTMAVVAAGFALAGFLFHALRLKTALHMRREPTDSETLQRHLND
jgi:GPH family glycoside/pentoside/hexuronide:cation symporter